MMMMMMMMKMKRMKRGVYTKRRIKIAWYRHKIKTNDANLQNDDSRLAEQGGEQKKKKEQPQKRGRRLLFKRKNKI